MIQEVEDDDDKLLAELLSDEDVEEEATEDSSSFMVSTSCSMSNYCSSSDGVSGEDDAFAGILTRLARRDCTLKRLRLWDLLDWTMVRDRRGQDKPYAIDGSNWLTSVAKALSLAQDCPHLTYLELCYLPLDHTIITQALKGILEISPDSKVWDKLTLDDTNMLGGLDWLVPSRIKSLRITTRSDVVLETDGWKNLGDMLRLETKRNSPVLQELCLQVGILDTPNLKYLVEGWRSHETLQRIDFSFSPFLDSRAVQLLASGLGDVTMLTSLSLASCSLTDNQVAIFVEFLRLGRTYSTLRWLNLEHNQVGPKSSVALGQLLSDSNSKLKSLVLNGCGITNTSINNMFANSVGFLQDLHLSNNCITDEGILHLANALRKSRCLVSLWLHENDFGDVGAAALLDVIRHNPMLTKVVVDYFPAFAPIRFATFLNRGGITNLLAAPHIVPKAIWPLVLERACRIRHSSRTARPADIIYQFLTEFPIICNSTTVCK